MEILKDVYQIKAPLGDRFVCQYLLKGKRASLLIDTGVAGMGNEVIIPYLKDVSITRDSLLYILNTHADVDHIGGNYELKKEFPNSILMTHKEDLRWVESKEAIMSEQYGWYVKHELDYPEDVKKWIEKGLGNQIKMDMVLKGDEEIRLDEDWKIEIIHLPGHSLGHTGVQDPKNNAIFISDAVLHRGVYSTKGELLGPPKYYDAKLYRKTIKRLKGMKPKYLITAHYELMKDEKAISFLNESLSFTRELDEILRNTLSEKALTTKELLERINPKIGPYPSMSIELSACIISNLKVLEKKGEVRKVKKGEFDAWIKS
ncbi:MAG: MBL fold metallo-hydrolase [Nitrososphaerales archaeon]